MLKTCVTCKQEKNISEFRKDASRPDGVQYSCKVCARSYNRSAYSTRYSERYQERNSTRRRGNVAKLQELKSTLRCAFCAEDEPVCLDFHHIDPQQKDLTISESTNGSWAKIEEEIKKCICVCSNCHRKIHIGKISILPS